MALAGAVALVTRPALGALRLGGRVTDRALVAALESRAAAVLVDRVLDAPLARHAVDRALAGPLPETIARDLVRHRVLERTAGTVLEGPALEGVLDELDAARVPLRVTERVLAQGVAEAVMERVLESGELERMAGQMIDSRMLDEVVARLLESEELWVLVEEIAQSPAVTDAITRQSLGFADQVAGGVRTRSRDADAWLERATRRALRRPASP